MFDTLSDKLQATLGDLRGHGTLSEEDLSKAMREIRLALLEADVNFQVVKDFVARVKERAAGADRLHCAAEPQNFDRGRRCDDDGAEPEQGKTTDVDAPPAMAIGKRGEQWRTD